MTRRLARPLSGHASRSSVRSVSNSSGEGCLKSIAIYINLLNFYLTYDSRRCPGTDGLGGSPSQVKSDLAQVVVRTSFNGSPAFLGPFLMHPGTGHHHKLAEIYAHNVFRLPRPHYQGRNRLTPGRRQILRRAKHGLLLPTAEELDEDHPMQVL
jgi:hypothetical protein